MDPIDDLVRRWRQNPNPAVTVALCDALQGSARTSLVQQVGEYATQRHAGDVQVMLAVARMYVHAQRFGEAQAVLVGAGKIAPREGEIYRWLGEVLLRRGDAERAEKVLERAIQLGCRDPEAAAWLERARGFRPMQERAGARAVAAEVARTVPTKAPGPILEAGDEGLTVPRVMPSSKAPPPLPRPVKPPPLSAPTGSNPFAPSASAHASPAEPPRSVGFFPLADVDYSNDAETRRAYVPSPPPMPAAPPPPAPLPPPVPPSSPTGDPFAASRFTDIASPPPS